MAQWHEAVELVRTGHSPGSVAAHMGVSIETVLPYIYRGVGCGEISRSEVVFSISREVRAAVEGALADLGSFAPEQRVVSAIRIQATDDVRAYLRLRAASTRNSAAYGLLGWTVEFAFLGDMYQIITDLELTLHYFIRQALTFMFGDDWWRASVPEPIRKECRNAQEGDLEPVEDPFCYTNFIHLKQIIDKHWGKFVGVLPNDLARNKPDLLSRLSRLNQIRNRVMHPVKQRAPSEDDFAFVHECAAFLRLSEWRVFKFE